ncbi:MAG TPA: metal ABC transporter ATP-binding protein [Treponemataceae bacterium]|nr:metal ABC transporter ATP-binding protein [Treponemataceae bacterium]
MKKASRQSPFLEKQDIDEGQKTIAFRFNDVSFAYGSVSVFENISFHVHENEFVALVGANGAGKTTLLKLLLGLEKPQKGSVELFPSTSKKREELIGYVPQYMDFDSSFPISVYDVVKMGTVKGLGKKISKEEKAAIDEALVLSEVSNLAHRPYAALSGGQRRRVLVARALASQPKLIVLDEPTVNMDSESEKRLFETLRKLKGQSTILVVTHDSQFVSSLTDVVLCAGEKDDVSGLRSVVKHTTSPKLSEVDLSATGLVRVNHNEIIDDRGCCDHD